MKRVIALVFVVTVLLSTVFASTAGAVPGANNGKGPGNGNCTRGSASSPGLSFGANEKICDS